MQVLIITEGSLRIGFGHVTRCASLYQAFEERGIIPKFIVNGDETIQNFLDGNNCYIFNWINEQERLFELIEDADMAIIDSYMADYVFYERVSKATKTAVYIDDNKRMNYPEGIVINGSIYAEEINYPQKNDVNYLLGSQYIPLRKTFWEVQDKKIKEHIKSIMITFGGDDMRNMTPRVLGLMVRDYPELTKNVIIGKGFQNIKEIEGLKDSKTDLKYFPDAEGIKKVMLESDMAISAGGQTLYELARVGVPTIAIAVADNQMNNIRGWQKAGFIEYAGWWEDEALPRQIEKNLELLQSSALRDKMSKVGRSFVNGQGARKVVQEMIIKLETANENTFFRW